MKKLVGKLDGIEILDRKVLEPNVNFRLLSVARLQPKLVYLEA